MPESTPVERTVSTVRACYREGGEQVEGLIRVIQRPDGKKVFFNPRTNLLIDRCRIVGFLN